MATKVYKLNQPKNTATFTLYANHGRMPVGYEFKGGNQTTKVPATCTLRNEFYQKLLEESPLFKDGIIKIERTIKDGKAEAKQEEKKYKLVENVKTAEEAVEFIANTWGVRMTSAKQAKSFANKKGYDFPNLVIEAPKK